MGEEGSALCTCPVCPPFLEMMVMGVHISSVASQSLSYRGDISCVSQCQVIAIKWEEIGGLEDGVEGGGEG